MRMGLMIVGGLSSMGCGVKADQYGAEYAAVACELEMACTPESELLWDTRSACEAFYVSLATLAGAACGEYDAGQAKRCLNELEALTCSVGEGAPDEPLSCSSVFAACEIDAFPEHDTAT